MTEIVMLWMKDNAKHLGWPLAVIFCGLWLRGCGALSDCQDKLAVQPVTVTQTQAVTQTAKASVKVQIVYRDVPGQALRPLPCPDLTVEADSSTEQTHWQSQQVAQKASESRQDSPRNVLFVGSGYLEGPTASAGYGYGPWRVGAQAGIGRIGGGLTLDVIRW